MIVPVSHDIADQYMAETLLAKHETKSGDGDLAGTYHRIAGIGPSYKVLTIVGERYASVLLLETGETVPYQIADIRLDPHPDDTCSHSPST